MIKTILATDCGSTTTKAILIEKINNEYRLTYRGEAPTTVEAPFEDVTKGVLNAVMEIEELSNRQILNDESVNKLEGLRLAEDLRYNQKSISILFVKNLSFIEKMRFFFYSNKFLYMIRQKMFSIFSGW